MPSVRGSGASLGGAFRDALAGLHAGHGRESYDRVGWSAQFKQLFSTERGYRELSSVLEVKQSRTVRGWLDGTITPSAQNQARIRQAYEHMHRGGLPDWVKDGNMAIRGSVAAGGDVRERGSGHNAPLHVDFSNGHWSRVEDALVDDEVDVNELGELVAEDLVAADIGDVSGGWGFPGGSYGVSVGS